MAKTRSFGTKVYLDGVAIGGLTDVNISAGDVTNVDTSCHDVDAGFRTFVAGLKDGGTVELSGKYDYADAGQEDWREAMGDTAEIYIIMPDNSGFAMKVIVGSFNATAPLDDAAEFTASAKITGEVFPVYPTMIVTGTLSPDVTGTLYHSGFSSASPEYTSNGLLHNDNLGSVAFVSIKQIALNYYMLRGYTSAGVRNYESSAVLNTVMTPDMTTYTAASTFGTGTPTVTGS